MRKSSPSAHLKPGWRTPRLADWGPIPENLAGRPHLKPQVGVHQEQRLATPSTRPRRQTSQLCDSAQSSETSQDSVTQAQSRRSADQRPGCLRGNTRKSTGSEQLLPSPCAQIPAGTTGSLGLRQNTQQRGAAGLGETAFPGKT